MTIRRATVEDVDALVAMGDAFVRQSPYGAHFTPNPDQARRLVGWLLEHGAVFVAEAGALVGMLGVAVVPHPISGELFGSELFWWVDPSARGTAGLRLLRAAEAWVRETGGAFMQLVAPDERAMRLYERLGYTQIEVAYQRRWE